MPNCVRCQQPIAAGDKTEPYAYPPDGRLVHSRCVGELLGEILDLMARVPEDVRLIDPEEPTDAADSPRRLSVDD